MPAPARTTVAVVVTVAVAVATGTTVAAEAAASAATAASTMDATCMPSTGNCAAVVLARPMAMPAMGISIRPTLRWLRRGQPMANPVALTPTHLATLRATTKAPAAGANATISSRCRLAPA